MSQDVEKTPMRRLRPALGLLAAVVLGAGLHPAAAASPPGTVLLSLAQRPGDAATLHRLAHGHGDRRAALAQLAPAATHLAAVERYAREQHLTVRRADAWTVTLAGPADTLATAFGTRQQQGRAISALHVPASLRTDVTTVSGLDPRPLLRPQLVPFGLTGAAVRLRYGVPLVGWTGAGVTVGTLNLTGWDPTDLTTYAGAAGLGVAPGQVTTIAVDGPANPLVPDGSGDDIEVAMDAQAILATAPAAKQRMYFAPNDGVGTVDVFNQMALDGAAGLLQVASTSWGLCETLLQSSPWYVTQMTQAIDRMLAAGVTLYAASGDSGKYDCSRPDAVDNTPSVDFPASYPGVVAVGGTRAGLTETAWGNLLASPGTSFAGNGGGGGRSVLFSRPGYQGGSDPQRQVPDVSSVADPSTGLGIVSGGSWLLGGGTSLGAPTWAGLTAAALSAAGRTTGLGDIHATLYAHPEAFQDVLAGSNGYAAAPGYDLATGLGTPNWGVLGPILTGLPTDTAAPTTTVTAGLLTGTDTRVRFRWAGHDPSPSSGIASYAVQVTQVGGGSVWSTTTGANSTMLTLAQGRSYVLTTRTKDVAGHVGPPATVRVSLPRDDAAFSRTGTWNRRDRSGDFLGSHVLSGARGSSATLTVTGRSAVLSVLRAPSAGYLDVYVDGVRTTRLDLYAASVLPRQAVRVLSSSTSGTHTIRLVVVGAHRAAATGSYVFLDSVTVSP
jgi:hypothetical protein